MAMAVEPQHHWMVTGSNFGVVSGWDIRFRVSLRSLEPAAHFLTGVTGAIQTFWSP